MDWRPSVELKETVAWCWCGWWKVTVCNDADAAILAEQWVGAAKGGIKNFIMLSTIAAAPVTLYRWLENGLLTRPVVD